MTLQFSIFQEIFLVAFSILYGVMLQTHLGVIPFPWGQTLRNREEITGLDNKSVQLRRRRLLYSIFILNVFPFIYAILVILLLNSLAFGFWEWECWLLMFITFWAGLGVFGFQRIYGWLALKNREIFPEAYNRLEKQQGLDPKAPWLSVTYYLATPFILLLGFIYKPLIGFIFLVALFLILIIWLAN